MTVILGETEMILRSMTGEQLMAFNSIKDDSKLYKALLDYAHDQKLIRMDKIYRLRRAKSQDDLIKNGIEHEYYSGRIAELVVFLQIIENAFAELEKRERKNK